MANFTTINKKDKRDILTIKAKESFYNNVSNLMSKANEVAVETKLQSKKDKANNINLVSRGSVPESHKMIADSFMIIKKIFGKPVIQCRPLTEEMEFLAKYDFNQLEFSTYKQIENELSLLKKWSYSRNPEIQKASDAIITIRAKELKNLIATNYVNITNEIYNGYKALEQYFENISKYQR
ncbi:MAG: hypothetical protein ACD_20C00161G0005 [uncultured bacterium]|nr:MAG: hypothetical protein ACD_20C00161G0005 [uncultured bacterium]